MKTIYLLFVLFFFGLIFACSTGTEVPQSKLKNGDLIFVEARTSQLSGAINRVTQLSETEKFDHVGILKIGSEGVFVLHASVKKGSNKELLEDFYKKNVENNQQMVVYRLEKAYQYSIDNALEKAHSMLGKPYNFSYVLNDQSYYCSDFIERAFRENKIFGHIPMNFKDPETGNIDDFWTTFYDKLGVQVPQDEPGTNPNQLAKSDKLKKLGRLKL